MDLREFIDAAHIDRGLLGDDKLELIFKNLPASTVEGDAAELGVYRGATSHALCRAMPERTVFLFDTFSGIPAKGEHDTHDIGDFGDSSKAVVRRNLAECENAVLCPGLFPGSAGQILWPKKFAFIHFDFDQYEATLAGIKLFWPLVAAGGVMIFDDWQWERCPGVAKAITEYFGQSLGGGEAVNHQFIIRKPDTGKKVILIVGDILIDETIHGRCRRLAPEAPVPIVDFERREFTMGGAGNVASKVVDLGGIALLCGVYGLSVVFRNIDFSGCVQYGQAGTKTRIMSDGHLVARIDREHRGPLPLELEDRLLANCTEKLERASAVVVSDYAKGVVSYRLAEKLIELSRERRVPLVVDPKGPVWRHYRGCTVIKPNWAEFEEAKGQYIDSPILLTKGKEGATLFRDGATIDIPPGPPLANTVGAGDGVAAAMALALADGCDLTHAARAAVVCRTGENALDAPWL